MPSATPRLDILKALGDNTRYAIYLELARSPLPLSTAEVADVLDLHVNTVRPHLERMRDVGLLDVRSEASGGVGRPQHLYSLAADAPALGLEPSPFPMLARVLLAAAGEAGLDPEELADAGRDQGRADARAWPDDTEPIEALIVEQARLGFDPEVVDLDDGAVMAFAHCPFRDAGRGPSRPGVPPALRPGRGPRRRAGRGRGRPLPPPRRPHALPGRAGPIRPLKCPVSPVPASLLMSHRTQEDHP